MECLRCLLTGDTCKDYTAWAWRRDTVRRAPSVLAIHHAVTLQLGPEEVLLALGVHLRPEEMIGDLTEAIARLERRIRLTDRRSRVSSSRSSPPRQSHKSNDDHR